MEGVMMAAWYLYRTLNYPKLTHSIQQFGLKVPYNWLTVAAREQQAFCPGTIHTSRLETRAYPGRTPPRSGTSLGQNKSLSFTRSLGTRGGAVHECWRTTNLRPMHQWQSARRACLYSKRRQERWTLLDAGRRRAPFAEGSWPPFVAGRWRCDPKVIGRILTRISGTDGTDDWTAFQ